MALESFKSEKTSRTSHPHITALLAAFEYQKKYHLVLPFAEGGNLRQLWESHPDPTKGSVAWYSDEWLIGQCYGIVDALAKIHGHTSLLEPHGTSEEVKPKLHQDIKPENILCFREQDRCTLKLTDFGFSRELDSKKLIPKGDIKGCLTYRPPESDLRTSMIGHSWDVWCLGCVFLEFVTWFIDGLSGVETFAERRSEENTDNCCQEDTFFLNRPEGFKKRFASTKLKLSVTEVSSP